MRWVKASDRTPKENTVVFIKKYYCQISIPDLITGWYFKGNWFHSGTTAISKDYKIEWLDEISEKEISSTDEDEIDYKFINYNRDEEGIEICVTDNPPIHLDDDYELFKLSQQLQLIYKEVERMPF